MGQRETKIYGLEAAIFDLDGVVTKTARIHMKAWRQMFNDMLSKRDDVTGAKKKMTTADYRKYLDGKPRYQGAESFLLSRNIKLPFGKPDDDPAKETVCGLGNKKNMIYRSLLKKESIEVFQDTVSQIKLWRSHGLKTAIVSSSKNCELILEKTGLTDLFDVRVDGIVAEEHNLKGKPSPDIFLEAAKELDVSPSKAAVFEDAISGVRAAEKGKFAFVVGISKDDNYSQLLEHGGDMVISDFHELNLYDNPNIETYFTQEIPNVFSEKSSLTVILEKKTPVIFLDYDGTLTPIVKHPNDALLSHEMRQTIDNLSEYYKIAIISGRDMDEIKGMIQLDNIIYAGSHGYRISGPGGLSMEYKAAVKLLPDLVKIKQYLVKKLEKKIKGIQIEGKRYAVAVHYRNVAEEDVSYISGVVDDVVKKYRKFIRSGGKKIFEIKPGLSWNKGKAVNWILKNLKLSPENDVLPIYLGDDVTDEDAFKALVDKGIGILVGSHDKLSNARYRLEDVYQVKLFLQFLINSA